MILRGASMALLLVEDEEILLTGPAGTSKTVAACKWLIDACGYWPGSQHLLCRAERASMTDTILVTMDSVIGDTHPEVRRVSREQRHSYRLFGSEIVIAGLDDPAKCYGSAYGRIVLEEAIQGTLGAWELFGRAARDARYRRGAEDFHGCPHQRLCVTNPGDPEHWLNRRATREPAITEAVTREQYHAIQCYNRGEQDGEMRRLISVHQDNPIFFDMDAWAWTPAGAKYLKSLDKMSGYRRDRMKRGKWVSGVGDPVFDAEALQRLRTWMEKTEQERPTRIQEGTVWLKPVVAA